MGDTDCVNYLEVGQLKLSAEHFPISCSLAKRVEEQFANTSGPKDGLALGSDELLAYLQKTSDMDLTPYAELLHQLEGMGDPALPSREHAIALRWVGEALYHYEQRFPLEEPLATSVRRLKPLAASMAVIDPDFMQPDVHPLHQFMDAIQQRAVGWQPTLGRAGANLEKQVEDSVQAALHWLEDNSTDITSICAEFMAGAERDLTRAERMTQRVMDTEAGKAKTARARRIAAEMINGALARYQAPHDIGEFLKGPWYDSAQLLLLKAGESSEDWEKMAKTTELLLDSVQSLDGVEERRRQHVFTLVSQLPKIMRRWLLSLHHDTNAVNEAMDRVEAIHLRVLRKLPMELMRITQIKPSAAGGGKLDPELAKGMDLLQELHWFAIETYKQGTVRAQLVYKSDSGQRLVFANMAGVKVLEYSYQEFDKLMSRKRVTALPNGGAFSLCLAIAAGLDTQEKLDAMYASVAGHPDVRAARTVGPRTSRENRRPAAPPPSAPSGDILNEEEMESLASLISEPAVEDLGRDVPSDSAESASPTKAKPEATTESATSAAAETKTGRLAEPNMPDRDGAYSGSVEEPEQAPAPPAKPETPIKPRSTLKPDTARINPEVVAVEDLVSMEPLVAMGANITFRDGNSPVTGMMAVFDPDGDQYIFVNRSGHKLREVSGRKLREMLEQGLAERNA